MKRSIACSVIGLACALAWGGQKPVPWRQCLRQKPEWYASAEAVRIADNVLLHQRNDGGWPKNIDMAATLDERAAARLRKEKGRRDSTIDNGATHTQMRYLAKVCGATRERRVRDAFLKAMDLLVKKQYPTGGWPQTLASAGGYSRHITFNDGAMVGVMSLLRDARSFGFMDDGRRKAATRALDERRRVHPQVPDRRQGPPHGLVRPARREVPQAAARTQLRESLDQRRRERRHRAVPHGD